VHGLQPVLGQPVIAIVDPGVHDIGDARDLPVGRRVELGQGAVAELAGRAVHERGPAPLAEDLQEGEGLAANPPELPPLLDDESPRADREQQQDRENELRDRSGVQDQLEDPGTERLGGRQQVLLLLLFDHT